MRTSSPCDASPCLFSGAGDSVESELMEPRLWVFAAEIFAVLKSLKSSKKLLSLSSVFEFAGWF